MIIMAMIMMTTMIKTKMIIMAMEPAGEHLGSCGIGI